MARGESLVGTGSLGFEPGLVSSSGEPVIVSSVIHDLDDDDVPLPTVARNRVKEPPERRQVLYEEILQPVPAPKRLRDSVLLHGFSVQAVCYQNRPERASPVRDGSSAGIGTRLQRHERLRRGWGQDHVFGTESHYSRGPFRIASRSSGEASGTQRRPLLPSATMPWPPRKSSATFKF